MLRLLHAWYAFEETRRVTSTFSIGQVRLEARSGQQQSLAPASTSSPAVARPQRESDRGWSTARCGPTPKARARTRSSRSRQSSGGNNPLDLYRMLAAELGLRPSPRAQIIGDIKRALVTLVDQRGVVPIIILDDAQALRDEVLHELHALTSLDFDDREYLTIWLVGHLRLDRRLHLQQHAALARRV